LRIKEQETHLTFQEHNYDDKFGQLNVHVNEINQGDWSLFTCDVTYGRDDRSQTPCLFTYGATRTGLILAWNYTFTPLYDLIGGTEKTLVLSYRFDQHIVVLRKHRATVYATGDVTKL